MQKTAKDNGRAKDGERRKRRWETWKISERRRRTSMWWRTAFCYATLITSRTWSAMLDVPQVICGARERHILHLPWCTRWRSHGASTESPWSISLYTSRALRCCAMYSKPRRVSGSYAYMTWCRECCCHVELAYFWRTLRWIDAFVVGDVPDTFAGRLVSVTAIDEDSGERYIRQCKVFLFATFHFQVAVLP